ncbi:MAG: L-2-hydroxyglutarate oxidase [Chloroflexi bacterium]|jgi:L-2-hydroxyglutarate oxidase LhgO|nr:L-2-hydroxyglutarate oxidase [Chloroflexota bacterium]
MTSERADVVIVGGGIVGLATAYRLLERRPDLRLVVLEKEPDLASHQTGRNSGVIHSPNTYAPGSLKARLCAEGRRDALAFADAHGVQYAMPGELIVATDPEEIPRLDAIVEKARANGVTDARTVGPEEIREIEPHVAGLRAFHVRETGIIDWRDFALALADAIRAQGAEIRTGAAVTGIAAGSREVLVSSTSGAVRASGVITCAGLWSDRVASMTDTGGPDPDRGTRIVPFRGDYFVLKPRAAALVRGLVYPVPDPRYPFLGVHLTVRIDGEVWAGPNAVLAFARDGYRRRDVDVRDLAEVLTNRGFLTLARAYWKTGAAEMWRDWWAPAFVAAIRRYLPAIERADVEPGPSGVRAQALGPGGALVEDFLLTVRPRVVHVRNAPSPAATASLAIGREIAERAEAAIFQA